jgi:TrmH RNA methyltransferase
LNRRGGFRPGPERDVRRSKPASAPPRRRETSNGADASALELTFGHRAALAVLSQRGREVVHVACVKELVPEVERVLGRTSPLPRIEVFDEWSLEHRARSNQHEGLVVEARPRRWASTNELAERLLANRGAAIALDRVRNSYNIGAILRSAAFFGIDAALLGAPAPHPGVDPNAIRVAEGGVENLMLCRTTDLADTLKRLRARGVRVYGADGQASADVLTTTFARPCIVIVGNEREGLNPRVRAECDTIVAIRGTGAVESLNVGVAAGVLCSRLMA